MYNLSIIISYIYDQSYYLITFNFAEQIGNAYIIRTVWFKGQFKFKFDEKISELERSPHLIERINQFTDFLIT